MVDLHDHRMNGSTLDPLTKTGNEFMPLIEEMKSARLRFVAAIADSNEGFGWIWFANEKDLRAFLDLVVRYDSSPGSIYSRLVEPWHRPGTLPAWSIEAKAEDVSDCYLTDDGRQEYPDERAAFRSATRSRSRRAIGKPCWSDCGDANRRGGSRGLTTFLPGFVEVDEMVAMPMPEGSLKHLSLNENDQLKPQKMLQLVPSRVLGAAPHGMRQFQAPVSKREPDMIDRFLERLSARSAGSEELKLREFLSGL